MISYKDNLSNEWYNGRDGIITNLRTNQKNDVKLELSRIKA